MTGAFNRGAHDDQPACRDRVLSRRRFFGATALAAVGARFATPLGAQGNPHTDSGARPIPGAISPFGATVHHFPLPAPGTPLANLTEPSEITDFNGFIADTRIRGGGTGPGGQPLAYQADMGFMDGVFVANDGKHYNATWVFIWLDVYTGPVGSANLAQQIHDYNPHIEANGLFWTIAAPRNSVDVHLGAGQASLRLTTQVFDDHDLQSSLTKVYPVGFPRLAEITFDVEWGGILDRQHVLNQDMNFEGDFLLTGATIDWSARDASGVAFVSEPPRPDRVFYAVVGRERNGIYFT
jgi:hypothetical protein